MLAWKINQSPRVKKVFCAPGNGGIAEIAQCVDIPADNITALAEFARRQEIDLTIVGPEAPLVAGIVDLFQKEGLKIFGPSQYAAQLEGSKIFAKEFMKRRNIPTADFEVFETQEGAKTFLEKVRFPVVIKADGLAAGKGVFICETWEEANSAVDKIMTERIFKDAGARIVVEECLRGEEASILAVSDGGSYILLASSQDHKRIFDDDRGPNTGGMGAYSPAPLVTDVMMKKIEARIIDPAIRGMLQEGHPFKGVLYAGLMITAEGPKVLEFNVRFGDPETQAILPRLQSDLLDIVMASCEGRLNTLETRWDNRSCVCVVMSSGGYPGNYEKGKEITGLEESAKDLSCLIFHAGTKRVGKKILTSGGRVLGVTALGSGIAQAIETAYKAVEIVRFDRCFFRRDIGAKALGQNASADPTARV